MSGILGYADTDRLVQLVLLLLGFYVVFAFQNIIHAVFFGLGKTNYLLVQSVVTNAVYYGGAFLLYRADIWVPTLWHRPAVWLGDGLWRRRDGGAVLVAT
mgnify:CR=1 FL=1